MCVDIAASSDLLQVYKFVPTCALTVATDDLLHVAPHDLEGRASVEIVEDGLYAESCQGDDNVQKVREKQKGGLDLLNCIKERLNSSISIDNELATLILEGLVLRPIANPTDELHAARKSVYITHADVEALLLLLNIMNDLQGFYGS